MFQYPHHKSASQRLSHKKMLLVIVCVTDLVVVCGPSGWLCSTQGKRGERLVVTM